MSGACFEATYMMEAIMNENGASQPRPSTALQEVAKEEMLLPAPAVDPATLSTTRGHTTLTSTS